MKQCTCYALRAVDCTCKPAKYGELYTSPTAKQEQSVSVSNPIGEFPKTILAVIKEVANRNPKNGLDRWTDYETGAYMQDDADAALLWIKNKAKQEQSAEHVGEPVGDGIDEAAFLERFQQNLDRGHKPCQTCEALARTVMLDQPSPDTTPQQRTWVVLTDDEIDQGLCRTPYVMKSAEAWRDGVRWAYHQLKEKNNA